MKLFGATYGIKDLEILYQQKSFEEFLQHARDILPSERNSFWETMVREMAIELIEKSVASQNFTEDVLIKIEKVSLWPSLVISEPFQKKRTAFAQHFFNRYLIDEKTEHIKELENFWNNTPAGDNKVELGMVLANTIIKKNIPTNSWEYFLPATHHPNSATFCQDEALQQAFYAQLKNISYLNIDDKKSLQEQLLNIAFPECWKVLKTFLLEESQTSPVQTKELILTALDQLQLLNREEYDFNLVLYLLEGPIVGPLFNFAWARVKYLGENFKDRQKLNKQLFKRALLPDASFAGADLKKRVTLISFIQENLPEYLEYYEKTCINYLKGNGTYPQGNPTLNCNQYFETVKNEKWLNQNRYQKYLESKIPKGSNLKP
jgi:hypothetical protein